MDADFVEHPGFKGLSIALSPVVIILSSGEIKGMEVATKMNETKNEKLLSIIVFSGNFDKAVAAFTLATAAAAANYEVNLFFTFWGLNIIRRKPGRSFTGKGVLAKVFNFLMGGLRNLPLSRLNFLGLSPVLMTGMMKSKNVATLTELIQAAKDLKVHFVACEMAMHILEIKQADLIDEVSEVVGATTFLERAKGGNTLFIS